MSPSIVLLNIVGLTPRLLPLAPRLNAMAKTGWVADMPETLPAVTCTAQATILTGKTPDEHGVVANGWLFRNTNEVRFWQQSNRLIQAEPIYETARFRAEQRQRVFKSAKLFWWFNQGAAVDVSITPKPWYGVDGNKVFDVAGTPDGRPETLKRELGPFPFPAFWGPTSGLASTQWIAAVAEKVITEDKPNLTLVYLPHLDYNPQRYGPSGCNMKAEVEELDAAVAPVLDAAKKQGAEVWVVSEYGHCNVSKPVYLNRHLRDGGFLSILSGPFGEQIDFYTSRAFAVCDHQLAHIYVREPKDVDRVKEHLAAVPGVAKLFAGAERAEVHLTHLHSGEIVALSDPDAWFAYPYWQDDRLAPDYARAVAIHNKPGFDPCELFWDPALMFPKLRAARRLIQKKLGFRTIFDVVPLDARIVKGSHGLAAADAFDRPLLIGHGPNPGFSVPMTRVKDLILNRLGLEA